MTELDKLVERHLALSYDMDCDEKGHELISRACVHCGLTIHQISKANNGVLPMRTTPQERKELRSHLKRRITDAQAIITEAEGLLDATPEIEEE
jgi:hypothetical protein